jgi:hypothetical protein
MPRTLLPPDDPDPGASSNRHLTLDDQATLDFLRGDYRLAADATAPRGPHRTKPHAESDDAGPPAVVIYLPGVAACYAIVQYDVASARIVRRVVGLFGGAGEAEGYAQDNGYCLYDVVPATAVIPQAAAPT